MPINDRGYFQPLNLPPLDRCWPELQPLVKEYNKHRTDLKAAEHRLGVLEAEQIRAEEQDNVAYAKALREGKKDPGNVHVDKLVADRKQTRRNVEALKELLVGIENEIQEVFDDTQAAQLSNAAEAIEATLTEYEAAIDAVAVAREKLVSVVAMRSFLQQFSEDPEGKGYRPNHWPLWKLYAQYGEQAGNFGEIVEALRFDRATIYDKDAVRRLFSRLPGPLASVPPGVGEFTREAGLEGVVEVRMS